MYDRISIQNYRSFAAFELTNLTRVNLLVGKNNAGKTSILEAIELVASGGRPVSLLRSPRRRGELSLDPADDRNRLDLDVRHLFYGHKPSEGARFEVSAQLGSEVQVVRCDVRRVQRDANVVPDQLSIEPPLVMFISGPDNIEGASLPIWGSGTVLSDVYRRVNLAPSLGQSKALNVSFLGTEGAEAYALQQIWDGIVLTAEEDKVVGALRILEPSIERLAFTSRDTRSTSVAYLKLSGEDQRVPLGSLGDGMRRLLALAVYLARAADGILLVDEIDTGLHHTALESMWHFIVENARRLGVQVFATSHSGDCIRSLAWLQAVDPSLAGDVSVHRVEREAITSVRYSAEDISIAARHHIEVRG